MAALRFATALGDVMQWAHAQWGDDLYAELKVFKKPIEDYLESEDIHLFPKNRKALLDPKVWQAQKALMETGEILIADMGQDLFMDFNQFTKAVDQALKSRGIQLSAGGKKQIINAVSWRDEAAARVIRKVHRFKGEKLDHLLHELNTTETDLCNYGYWPDGKAGQWTEYEPDSELRDTENIPLKEDIHTYFLREVRPHVEDAWIADNKTQVGYEISFNRYFYKHKPLRSLEEVTTDILKLEQKTEGLLKKLVSFKGWDQ